MKINDFIRQQLKSALRRACVEYVRAMDAGESPYHAYIRLRTLIRRLDGQWKGKRSRGHTEGL